MRRAMLLGCTMGILSACQGDSVMSGLDNETLSMSAVRIRSDGEGLMFSTTLRNISRTRQTLYGMQVARAFDPLVSTPDGAPVWGVPSAGSTLPRQTIILAPHDSLVLTARWDGKSDRNLPVTSGNYVVIGVLRGRFEGEGDDRVLVQSPNPVAFTLGSASPLFP